MVQGNSARRKELAVGRRQDRKDEIERKKAGASRVTPAEARARLLDFASKPPPACAMFSWSMSPSSSSAPAWCPTHFREGVCPRGKRCRLAHAESISHLAGVPAAAPDAEPVPELARGPLEAARAGGEMVYSSKLRTTRRAASSLLFVECGGELVFDAEEPGVFERWAARQRAAKARRGGSGGEEAGGEEKAGGDALPAAEPEAATAPAEPEAAPAPAEPEVAPAPLSKKERRKQAKAKQAAA
jgi:hypothetical protein